MNLVRYGLIGFGAWGKHHADAITKAHNAELVGIAAHSEPTAADATAAYPNAFVSTDYHALLARPDLDVIDVVVPSYLHHEVATAVLESGRHLLLEKPMGISLEQCDAMIASAKQHDRLLCVGHELRLSSLISLLPMCRGLDDEPPLNALVAYRQAL